MNNKTLKAALAGTVLLSSSVHAMLPDDSDSFIGNHLSSSNHQRAYQLTNQVVQDEETTRKKYFNDLLSDLSIVQEIYDFDPNILDNELDEKISIDPRKKNISFFMKISCFYSEDSSEREQSFDKEIKIRIMDILKRATVEPYYDFPQPLKVFGAVLPLSNTTFLNIAMRDIFKDNNSGLKALKDALIYFRDNGKLNKDRWQGLRLFNKLAGFYFDPQAIQHIIKLNDCLTVPQTKTAKLAFLRVLQLEGELFKQILPSTLNFADLPSESTLRLLRSKLSHLSKSKLDKLLGNSTQVQILFKTVDEDLKLINANLKKIQANHKLDQKKPPCEFWSDIKSRSEERTPVLNGWKGVANFIDFLTVNPPEQKTPSFDEEIKSLVPFPDDKPKTEKFFKDRQTVWNRLIEKGKNKEDLSNELREKAKINVLDEEEVFEIYQEVQGNPFTKEPQDKYLVKIMRISQDDFENYFKKKMEIDSLVKQQNEIKRLLTEKARSPSKGFGNFSDKYAEFCNKLKERGFIESFNPYNWLAEPNLFEALFHKVKNINIFSLEDKQKIRRERLEEILEIIEGFRDLLGISTNLFLETEKESFTTLIYHKRAILEEWHKYFEKRWINDFFYEACTTIQNLDLDEFYRLVKAPSEGPKEIQGILRETDNANSIIKKEFQFIKSDPLTFYGLLPPDIISKISAVQSEEKLNDLKKDFDHAIKQIFGEIDRILEYLNKLNHRKNFQEEFCNKTRFNKKLIIEQYLTLANVKTNYRSRLNTALIAKFIEKFKTSPEEIAACEFFIASAYECLKEIKDYPELQTLASTDEIRNYFFHIDLTGGEPLSLKGHMDGMIYNHGSGIVAKEAAILAINIKAILEDLKDRLH